MPLIVHEKPIQFLNLLGRLGLTEEIMDRCLDDETEAQARLTAFLNPPTEIEAALSEPAAPVPPPEPMWRPVEGDPMAIEVNLAADPRRFLPGVEIEWYWGPQTGWVLVEHKENALYVAGKKVVHHLEPEQAAGDCLYGDALFDRLQTKMAGVVLHPNIKSAMMENWHLFPESWKGVDQGRELFIFFWAVGFRCGRCVQYVECVCFRDGAWYEGHFFALPGSLWNVNNPAAVTS